MFDRPGNVRIFRNHISQMELMVKLSLGSTEEVHVPVGDSGAEFEALIDSETLGGGSESPPAKVIQTISLTLEEERNGIDFQRKAVKDTYVLKCSKDENPRRVLREQANWILRLPKEFSIHFPHLRDDRNLEIDAPANYYIMDYIPYPSLWDHIQSGVSVDDITYCLDRVLDFVYGRFLYLKRKPRRSNGYYILSRHILRILNRVSEIQRTHLNSFFSYDEITLNGLTLKPPLQVLGEIMSNRSWMDRLEPQMLYRIHGDLHLDNILVYSDDPDNFKLIDPRGWGSGGIDYDQGKLLHSVDGLYHIWHRGVEGSDFFYEENNKGRRFEVKIQNRALLEKFVHLYNHLINELPRYPVVRPQEDWLLRATFAEACHFLSLGPFHVDKRIPSRIMSLVGIYLINSAISFLETGNFLPAFSVWMQNAT